MKKIKVIKGKGNQKPLKFHPGGLHESLNVPEGTKIPESKRVAALHGAYGEKAKKQALFAVNVLHH